MRYCERVEFFGKKMLLLERMEVRWKSDNEDEGVQYTFQDYVIKGCTSQDVIQVSSIIQLAVRILVKDMTVLIK